MLKYWLVLCCMVTVGLYGQQIMLNKATGKPAAAPIVVAPAPAPLNQPARNMPPASTSESMAALASRQKMLAETLIEYANQASKSLESIPILIAKTKIFIEESMALIASLKNDLASSYDQISRAQSAQDVATRLERINTLIDQNLVPLIGNLAQLSLSAAELIYATNAQIIEPFSDEVATRGINTATGIRELVKAINGLTNSLQALSKRRI